MTSRKLVADALDAMALEFAGREWVAGDDIVRAVSKLARDVRAGRFDPLGRGATPDAIRTVVFARTQLGLDIAIQDPNGIAPPGTTAARAHGEARGGPEELELSVSSNGRDVTRWVLRGALEAVQLYRERGREG